MDARTGFGLTRERQEPATPPELSTTECPVSTEATPVRRLPIGAEPQSDGGVHFRV